MPDYNNNHNSSNDKDAQKHVQTRNITFTNGKAEIPSALSVIYYDDTVRITFATELPDSERTEKRRYDYDHAIMTSVSRTKCQELYNAYKKIIVPAIEKGESAQVSIPLAGVNQLMIDTNVDETGTPHPKLKYIKAIDERTLIADPKNVVSYEFNTGEYILGYNEATGQFKERVVTYNELELFMSDLNSLATASSNAYIHTDRVVNRYWRDTLDSKLNKIGEKLGIDLSYRQNMMGRYNGGGSIFDVNSKNNAPVNNTPISSIDDLDNELSALNDLPFQ